MAFIPGTAAADTLVGTDGSDLILGHGGADFLVGRPGNDVIFGGPQNDTIAGDNIPLPGGPLGQDVFGPYPAQFGGTPGNNLIIAGAGDDSVHAGFGADTVLGGPGNDTLIGYGAAGVSPSGNAGIIRADGPDLLDGGPGDDLLRGGGGADTLLGGAGDDTLIGGTGVDVLAGGPGHDVFLFGRQLEPFASDPITPDTGVGPGNRDVILDFQDRQDVIDLTHYLNFFPPPEGQPPAVFLGTDPFTATGALQVRYEIEDGNTIVQIVAPFGSPPPGTPPSVPEGPTQEIELVGVHHLQACDVILA
ncbi:hypothetical protein [Paracraurococcus lichenis]|uniref:Calcium-binding protein n=1 Tax=Paracraurococcus lichenis TaxID=3064888 RepID=A0ABT9DTI9_9PROT|nr:hypothetical protein [Paracraurococcus sp. LOR1-02]MDO9707193.1 hypothetical protein [Paracraurococcus sp. LOR1-02]